LKIDRVIGNIITQSFNSCK